MDSRYKQILLAIIISLCCAAIRLNADLLNGPYSPESQKLVNLFKDNNLPIPEKFKNIKGAEELINGFREDSDPATLTNLLLRYPEIEPLIRKNMIFTQALIQYIKNSEIPEYIQNLEYPRSDYQLKMLANFARFLNNSELFNSVISKIQEQTKRALLKSYISDLFSHNYNGNVLSSRDPDLSEYHKKAYNTTKEFTKKIVSTLENGKSTAAINEAFVNFINTKYTNDLYLSGDLEDIIALLLNLKTDINAISSDKKTFLDMVIVQLDQFKSFNRPDQFKQNLQNLERNIDFLKSKGAKTYAELTAQEKGQK